MKIRTTVYTLLGLTFGLACFAQQDPELYPNPFREEIFFITTPSCGDSIKLEIFNTSGVELLGDKKQKVLMADTIRYRLKLDNGIFFLRYQENTNEVAKKIMWIGDSTTATINLVLSGENLNCFEYPFEIFPNPMSNGTFSVRQKNLSVNYALTVHDGAGNLIFQSNEKNRTSTTRQFNLSHEADGTYFITVKAGDEQITEKLLLLRN